jgi:hypothetical protein
VSATTVWLLLGFAIAQPAIAADASSATDGNVARLSDLNWLTGVWQGQNGEDAVENVYFPQNGGEFLQAFTAVKGGQITVYELRSWRVENGRIVHRELIFGPELKPGREVADRYVTRTDATHVEYGESLITRTGEDSMTTRVVLHPDGAPARTVEIQWQRVTRLASP